jgi:hypothetical protein
MARRSRKPVYCWACGWRGRRVRMERQANMLSPADSWTYGRCHRCSQLLFPVRSALAMATTLTRLADRAADALRTANQMVCRLAAALAPPPPPSSKPTTPAKADELKGGGT